MSATTPTAVRWTLWGLFAWLGVYELVVLTADHPVGGPLLGRPATLVMSFFAAGLCAAAARRHGGRARWAWGLIAVGIGAWNLGDTYWSAVLLDREVIPVPSWADAGYLAFPALTFAGLAMLLRPSTDVMSRLLLVDGIAAGLAVGALVVDAGIDEVLSAADGVVINALYPLTDLVLIGLAVCALAVAGWRLRGAGGLVVAAMMAFWLADTSYLVTMADGSYRFPHPMDAGWTCCFLLLAFAAWQPATQSAGPPRSTGRTTVLPVLFAGVALAVLAHAGFTEGQYVATVLAVASLVVVCVRLLVTLRGFAYALDGSRHEALTDALTGLGNRRALMADLRAAVAQATPEAPAVLVLYDLDGFKHYNDSFGHPAGDALLARLGARLAAGATPGTSAYRIGGDEFCVIGVLQDVSAGAVEEAGVRALSDAGSGFAVSASHGTVVIPRDAAGAEDALRRADKRMYSRKHSGRVSAGRQVSDVLVTALVERDGGLGDHVQDVATLAVGVAARLGLDPGQCDLVGQAAVLHDVGKVAIPDAILDKPAPLDEAEWAFMRRHTVIGERIIGAAPALSGVARIVRASHERWDGGGYPDALAGADIPLGARIVAVCDAFAAMCAWRAYSPGRSEEAALAELQRCAGTQFDPAVVEAFCAERVGATGDPAAVS